MSLPLSSFVVVFCFGLGKAKGKRQNADFEAIIALSVGRVGNAHQD
jgi:hypothetical protein